MVTLNWCDALLISAGISVVHLSCSLDCLRLFYFIVLFYGRRLLFLVYDNRIFSDIQLCIVDLRALIYYLIDSLDFLFMIKLLESVIFCLIIVAKIFLFFLVMGLFVLRCGFIYRVKLNLPSFLKLVFEAVERECIIVDVMLLLGQLVLLFFCVFL